jgi:hypothetical protein
MSKSKCPVCDVRVPAVAGPWKRLCTKHEESYNIFPEHKFEHDCTLVRGKMINENIFEEEDMFEDEDCFA